MDPTPAEHELSQYHPLFSARQDKHAEPANQLLNLRVND
jgi:hypothetical protein